MNNIAEGASRTSEKDFQRFLEMSLGSAFEVETLLKISMDMQYTKDQEIENLIERITSLEKRINAFIQTLKRSRQ